MMTNLFVFHSRGQGCMSFCRGFWTINNFREAAFLSRNRGIHEAKAGSKSTAVADLLA